MTERELTKHKRNQRIVARYQSFRSQNPGVPARRFALLIAAEEGLTANSIYNVLKDAGINVKEDKRASKQAIVLTPKKSNKNGKN